jgi:anti-anti-sigma factor
MAPPSSPLRVSVSRSAGHTTVRLDGELDCATAPELHDVLVDVARESARVVVDAAGLDFVDVAGLRPLLALRQQLGPGSVHLRNAKRQIVRVIRLLDLADDLGLDG